MPSSPVTIDSIGRRSAASRIRLASRARNSARCAEAEARARSAEARLAEESSARLNELLAVPDHARSQVKQQLRHTLADTLQYDGGRSDDLDLFMDLATSTDVQVQLKSYLKSLKKK